MHGSIRDRLEDVLKETGALEAQTAAEVNRHLASCPECANEIETMRDQAIMLRSLRAPQGVEPAPGFYARVMQRIEEGAIYSTWSVFIDGPFGKRLAYASLALALLLGTWVIGAERADGRLGSAAPAIAQESTDLPVAGDQAHQRDVVLVNFASYSEPAQ